MNRAVLFAVICVQVCCAKVGVFSHRCDPSGALRAITSATNGSRTVELQTVPAVGVSGISTLVVTTTDVYHFASNLASSCIAIEHSVQGRLLGDPEVLWSDTEKVLEVTTKRMVSQSDFDCEVLKESFPFDSGMLCRAGVGLGEVRFDVATTVSSAVVSWGKFEVTLQHTAGMVVVVAESPEEDALGWVLTFCRHFFVFMASTGVVFLAVHRDTHGTIYLSFGNLLFIAYGYLRLQDNRVVRSSMEGRTVFSYSDYFFAVHIAVGTALCVLLAGEEARWGVVLRVLYGVSVAGSVAVMCPAGSVSVRLLAVLPLCVVVLASLVGPFAHLIRRLAAVVGVEVDGGGGGGGDTKDTLAQSLLASTGEATGRHGDACVAVNTSPRQGSGTPCQRRPVRRFVDDLISPNASPLA